MAMMKFNVSTIVFKQLEVFNSIVVFNSIDMMHDFFFFEVASKMRFHYQDVLKNIFSMGRSSRMVFASDAKISEVVYSSSLPARAFFPGMLGAFGKLISHHPSGNSFSRFFGNGASDFNSLIPGNSAKRVSIAFRGFADSLFCFFRMVITFGVLVAKRCQPYFTFSFFGVFKHAYIIP